jgi:esterase
MKLHYKKLGEGDPIIIVHGLFGSADNWGTIGKKFAENNTVFLVDLRNHGRSPHDPTMNYEVMAKDILELIQDENIIDPVLLGHSMGGKAALFFSENHPNILKKLIVADIGIKSYPMHHDQIIKGLKNIDLSIIQRRSEALEALREYVKEVGIQQFLLKNLYWVEKGVLGWRMNLDVIINNIHEILKEIRIQSNTTETLFLRGEFSNYIENEDYAKIKKALPNSTIKTISNAGHWLHAENPLDFHKAVVNFIA